VNYVNDFFYGKGSVFIYDTALIFEGSKPKFSIPLITKLPIPLIKVGYELLVIKTTRTVPYSTILNYKKQRLPYNFHEIIYRLPNGRKCVIEFEITITGIEEENIYFTNKLEESLTVVRSLFGN
jgi:hypothetical protein